MPYHVYFSQFLQNMERICDVRTPQELAGTNPRSIPLMMRYCEDVLPNLAEEAQSDFDEISSLLTTGPPTALAARNAATIRRHLTYAPGEKPITAYAESLRAEYRTYARGPHTNLPAILAAQDHRAPFTTKRINPPLR